jgi:hypothetical protein
MAIKAPNYRDIVERQWVQRAVGAAAATVLAAGVTAASTLGAVEIAPTLSAPASGGRTRTATGTGDVTNWIQAAYRDLAPVRRPGATTRRLGSVSARAAGESTAPATASTAGTGGESNDLAGAPPAGDPPASHMDEQGVSGPGVSVGAAVGDTSVAVGADSNGVGASTGDTTVGSPPPEPPADGVTVSAEPGNGLPPIVISIP